MKHLSKIIQKQFDKICESGKLFRSSLTGQEIWDLYLASFEKPNDPVFRAPDSSVHNCNNCKNFIRRYGNIVAVDDNNNIVTMFDVVAPPEFASVVIALSSALKNAKIQNVFFETFDELNSLPYEKCNKNNEVFRLGIDKNIKPYSKAEACEYKRFTEEERIELNKLIRKNSSKEEILDYKFTHGVWIVKPDELKEFTHLHLNIPKMFVDISGKSVESIMAEYRMSKEVFQRGMYDIPLDTLNLVRDLIIQGSLLNGDAHLYKIEKILPLKKEFDKIRNDSQADNWCWVKSYKLPFAKFKNELIGVLCTELAEGKDLNAAVQAWNKLVDPLNYMKASAPITKKQIEEARKFVQENGYEESFDRRFATIDDIKVTEIKYINSGDGKLKTVSIFDDVKPTPSTRHKRSEFDGIEEVSIEKFMKDILPGCTSVEAFVTGKYENNMVSLLTANIKDSKPIFKWPNNYNWTFNKNLAGKSEIKEAVKEAGGNVDGVLNCRIAWNEDGKSIVDFDIHALEPNGIEIFFSSPYRKDRGNNRTSMSGQLDVDMVNPTKMGVENITWIDKDKMKPGVYKFWNKNYNSRDNTGFKAELEFGDESYTYEYKGNASGNVQIAEVTLSKDGEFTVRHLLPVSEGIGSSKEIYGLQTNEFHKVNLVCLSPNHWDGNEIGNKHYFFMLKNCKSPTSLRSFHAENLIPELAAHRKVLEVLGTTTMVESTDHQLSGLGFNATVRDELIVKLSGTHKRVIKIKF